MSDGTCAVCTTELVAEHWHFEGLAGEPHHRVCGSCAGVWATRLIDSLGSGTTPPARSNIGAPNGTTQTLPVDDPPSGAPTPPTLALTVIAILAALAFSCAPSTRGRPYPSPACAIASKRPVGLSVQRSTETTQDQLEAASRAVAYWRLGDGPAFVEVAAAEAELVVVASRHRGQLCAAPRAGCLGGRPEGPPGAECRRHLVLWVDAALDLGQLETTVRHELGHALGLRDRPEGAAPALMGPLASGRVHPVDVSAEELVELERRWPALVMGVGQ